MVKVYWKRLVPGVMAGTSLCPFCKDGEFELINKEGRYQGIRSGTTCKGCGIEIHIMEHEEMGELIVMRQKSLDKCLGGVDGK